MSEEDLFYAYVNSKAISFTHSGNKLTSSASSSATSDISYDHALLIAKTKAYQTAELELKNNKDIFKYYINITENKTLCNQYTQNSNIFIVMDELVAYNNLPKWLLRKLPGYQSFSRLGIEFTNIHNNRQMCSPSRASFQTSTINTGIQSNIDQIYQSLYIPSLSYESETIPKSIKKYNKDIITAYYGKEHLSSRLAFSNRVRPLFNLNTTNAFKCYGFDTGSMFGDTAYNSGYGFASDNIYLNTILNTNINNTSDYIDIDPITNEKTGYVGVLPFLKSRLKDNKPFHLQYHILNPHDTQQFWDNFSKIPICGREQFFAPFLKEQTTDVGVRDPYFYNEFFPDAYVKNENLIKNFFEKNFSEYSSCVDLLPFIESYSEDYVISSKTNPVNEYYSSMYSAIYAMFSLATDSSDIKSWKNLINNYYGLIIEADKYVFKIYNFLKKNNMLKNVSVVLIGDHGDLMSAHGLKQKGFPFKECVNVPCIVYSSKIHLNLKGTKNNVLGSLLDIAPTIDRLMNIPYKNRNFLGVSLINKYNDYFFPRSQNLPVMNIFNDVMNAQSCFINPDYTKSYFEYKYNFNMIIDYDIDGKLYKFGRFFNIFELFRYNFISNNLFKIIPLSIFKNSDFTNIEPLKESVVKPILDELILFMEYSFPSEKFTFEDAYNKIKNNFKTNSNSNSLYLVLFMIIMANLNKYYYNFEFIIPGVYSSWEEIINNSYANGYTEPFCYNITDDYNEVKNIFYQKNSDGTYSYDSSKEELFSRLNDKLNDLTIKQCMTSDNKRFTFIIPIFFYKLIFTCFYKFGTNIENYTQEQKNILLNTFYLNTYDSTYSQESSLLDIIANLD